ncbi:hypothetical protein K488DRAFT_52330, partial [Vararia minispora EC-137]
HCSVCNRTYVSPAALKQHFRDMTVHPNCTRCNEGFLDDSKLEEACTNHPERRCASCDEYFETLDALQEHYYQSSAHPKCPECDTGFADVVALREVRCPVTSPNAG